MADKHRRQFTGLRSMTLSYLAEPAAAFPHARP